MRVQRIRDAQRVGAVNRAAIAIAARSTAYWYRFETAEATRASDLFVDFAHLASDLSRDVDAIRTEEASAASVSRRACAASTTRGGR